MPYSSRAAEIETIRLAHLGANTANAYLLLGIEKGFYKNHGIDLKILPFQKGGPEIIAAAIGQQIDLGLLGTPILVGISRGFPIKVVGSPPLKGQEFTLVAQKEITSLQDLRGKNVGVAAIGGGQLQALRIILSANKIDPKDVGLIAYGSPGNGFVAMKSGQLAGAVLSEPNVSQIVLDGTGKVLADAADYYGRYQHSYIFATDAFIAKHPEAIRNFFAASAETILYAQSHRDELVAVAQKSLGLDPKLLNAVFDRQLSKWDPSQSIDEEGVLNAVKIVKQAGDIDQTYQPDLKKIIDESFLPAKEISNGK